MAWALKGAPLGRLLNVSTNQNFNLYVYANHAKQFFKPQLVVMQTANICGKALRDKTKKRPPPYPYETKNYGFLNSLWDKTTKRFDENSKIIVVEGPIASGKTTFAKELAEDLDMLYLPECNMDMKYINEYGFDYRQLDSQLPEKCQSFDIKNFYSNPNHVNVATFQLSMYILRYKQYIHALAHVMNTGQGVVLERCVYSDRVFLETMHKFGYISKGAKSFYNDIVQNSIDELMRPHLVIYLDIPVPKVMERIKKRNLPYEVKSKVLNPEYLSSLEDNYKQYLKDISTHAELLVYDWSDYGDVEVVVEDIERIDFDQYTIYDSKLEDWRLGHETEWAEQRALYTNHPCKLDNKFLVPRFDVPELTISGSEFIQMADILDNAPGEVHAKGYNADQGDKNILFKLKTHKPRFI